MTFENLTDIPDKATKLDQIVGQASPNIFNDFWQFDLLTYFLKFEEIATRLSKKVKEVIYNDFWKFDLVTYFLNIRDRAS